MSKLLIEIGGNVSEYQKALQVVKKENEKLEASLSNISKKSALAFGALSGAIGLSIAAFREQDKVERTTRATIEATGKAAGLTADEIFKMAGALQDVTTFGDEAIISGQNMLLTFKNIGGDVFPRVTEVMLDMSEAMGQDLKSSAIQLGKALNDPITGITALSRVGITFTEQQKDQIRVLQESGDIAAAQAIILKELESQFGGVAKAAAGGTGAYIQLSNAFGDLIEDIGRELSPALEGLSKNLLGVVTFLRENKTVVRYGAALLGIATVAAGLTAVVSGLALVFLKLRTAILAVRAANLSLTVSIKALISSTGIGLLVVAAIHVLDNWTLIWGRLQVLFQTATNNIAAVAKSFSRIVQGALNLDVDEIKAGYNDLKNVAVKSLTEIAEGFQKVEMANTGPDAEQFKANLAKMEEDLENSISTNISTLTEAQQEELNIRQNHFNDILSQSQTFAEMNEQQRDEFRLNYQEKLEEEFLSEKKIIQNALADELKQRQSSYKKMIEDKEKFGKTFALINQTINSNLVQGTKSAVGEMVQFTRSSNATLKAIGKAAAVADIAIKTAQSAMNIYAGFSKIPFVGHALGIAGAAAAVAFGAERTAQVVAAADGGLITGGLAGKDSVPTLTMPGELITPTRNFDEVVNAVAEKRALELGPDESISGGRQEVHVTVGFKDEAFEIIEQKTAERRSIGTGII